MAAARDGAGRALDHVAVFASLAAGFASAVPSCDLGAPVPACPGWACYDLVVHLGNVHAWAATILETGEHAARQNDEPGSRRPRDVADWYLGKAGDLLAVLRAADPERPCWTFSPVDHSQRFWLRRQVHETLVHLLDLHQARGSAADLGQLLPAEVAPWVAADGVAEVLEVFWPRMHARGARVELDAPLLLHACDTADTWLLLPRAGQPPEVQLVGRDEPLDRRRDLVTAPAADLMLLLWKRLRVADATVTLHGDLDRLHRFLGSRLTP